MLSGYHCILWSLVALVLAQPPRDPLQDLCRRYGHQTAVIDRKLYVDGGWVYARQLQDNPIPTMNEYLVSSNLDYVEGGAEMPKQTLGLLKNPSVPNVAGGVLWADEINKVIWQFGGEYESAPGQLEFWGYDVLLNQWNESLAASSSSSTHLQRTSYGAGTVLGFTGYYFGGYQNNLTTPRWEGPQIAASGLVTFDMDNQTMKNDTGPDSIGRAEGVLVSINASSQGMLVYFGGVTFPHGNSTEEPMPMNEIMLYDVNERNWYIQKATGDIPANRRKFCAGVAGTEDQSSYNVYLYGGFGFGENITGFDDVYILTMPTFEWIKWYPELNAKGEPSPHGMLTCNVIGNTQMIVMGGNFTYSDIKREGNPADGAQHNLDLGQVNYKHAKWYKYETNITGYSVPSAVLEVIGGTSTGGASIQSPSGGFEDSDLSVYFKQKATFLPRTPTRSVSQSTSTPSDSGHKSNSNIGAIVGGAIGGAALLIISAFAAWWFCFRKKKLVDPKPTASQVTQRNINKLTGDVQHSSRIGPGSGAMSPKSFQSHSASPYSTPPPFQQPGSLAPHSYQNTAYAQQQYYPMDMQQHYSHQLYPQQAPQPIFSMSGSPPDGIYPQQSYFPPPDMNRDASNVAYEMPIAKTPAQHQPQPPQPMSDRANHLNGRDSMSDQSHSYSSPYSPTNQSY